MWYVYVLKSEKDGGLYIGFTSDLKQRITRHQEGQVLATRYRGSLQLIYYEVFLNKLDAIARERYLKSGYGRQQLKSCLKNTLLL
jgi:putative endonuclease